MTPGIPPSASDVRVERADRVLTLTFDRPGDQNRLTRDVLLTMQGIADDLRDDDEIQAVVVTGSGSEFFSMGILNPPVRASHTKEQILDLVRIANRLYDAIEALPQVVIAAFNGAARAGAAELALACDIRLAAAHATFRLPEALWGSFPGAGGPVRLPEIVGRARALELIRLGPRLSPRANQLRRAARSRRRARARPHCGGGDTRRSSRGIAAEPPGMGGGRARHRQDRRHRVGDQHLLHGPRAGMDARAFRG